MSRGYTAGKSSVRVRSNRTTMRKISYTKDLGHGPTKRCDLCKAYGVPLTSVEIVKDIQWRCNGCLHMT